MNPFDLPSRISALRSRRFIARANARRAAAKKDPTPSVKVRRRSKADPDPVLDALPPQETQLQWLP